VQSSEGLLRIAPREIFEDVYVPLLETSGVIPQHSPKDGGEEPYVNIQARMQSVGDARPSTH
jgi:hypothetical protein